jgi:FkbM family methyltransferase
MIIDKCKAFVKINLAKVNLYKHGGIKSFMTDLSRLKKINSVLDIGACVGAFSGFCRELWPQAHILMLEANTSCEPHLKKTGIDYKICLLGNENKNNVIFYRSKEGGITTGESIYKEKTHHFDNSIEEIREMKKLDELVKKKFDFVKIDTQGSELEIMKGGVNLIANCKYLLLEVSTKEYNAGAPLYDEVVEYMDSIGFKTHFTIEDHFWTSDDDNLFAKGDIFQKDVVFIK